MIRSEKYSLYDQLMRDKSILVQDSNGRAITIKFVYINDKTALKFVRDGKVVGISFMGKFEIDRFVSKYEVKDETICI